MDIYSHKGYELVITYNSFTQMYEGSCHELSIYLEAYSLEGLHNCFSDRVDSLVGN